MDTGAATSQAHFVFEHEQLGSLAEAHRERYRSASPFPHVVIDDFLPPPVLEGVLAEFPAPAAVDWWTFDSPRERKLASRDHSAFGPLTSNLLSQFNSAPFIDFLQDLTGISGLVPDPYFHGGGLHQIEPGGFLKVHADFSRHPATKLERRLNLLLYLNRDWREEYGGALELWAEDMSRCEARIFPVFNRCVVFSTTDRSFHGHPEPLRCPDGMTRKSLALYYYSKSRPEERPSAGAHNTLFQARPGETIDHDRAVPASETGRRPALLGKIASQLAPPLAVRAASRIRRALVDRRRRHR